MSNNLLDLWEDVSGRYDNFDKILKNSKTFQLGYHGYFILFDNGDLYVNSNKDCYLEDHVASYGRNTSCKNGHWEKFYLTTHFQLFRTNVKNVEDGAKLEYYITYKNDYVEEIVCRENSKCPVHKIYLTIIGVILFVAVYYK